MKSIRTIIKNLKLLFRNKASAIVILFAPLLIVLIIGISFVDTQEGFTIGVHKFDDSDFTNRFVESIEKNNNVIHYSTRESCMDAIKQGVALACVSFPEDFRLSDDDKSEITFIVDESRLNLVYRLIADLTTNVGGEQAEISQEITTNLIAIIDSGADSLEEIISSIEEIKKKLDESTSDASSIKSSVGTIDTSYTGPSISNMGSLATSLRSGFSSMRSRALDVVSSGEDLIAEVDNESKTQSFEQDLIDLKNNLENNDESLDNFDELVSKVNSVSSSFDSLKSKLESVEASKKIISTKIDSLSSNIGSIKEDINSVSSQINIVLSSFNELEFRNPESIARPVTTNIETITSEYNNLVYSFPYLLMLVIMFVGIMLSSTLVFMEKDSKAFFRNFTTPTKDIFFMSMTYFTALIVIAIQILILLLGAYFILDIPLLNNLYVTLTILFLSTTLFIFLGMLIGNMFKTSESITMANIAVGSIFLFLSNIILPLETLSQFIQEISKYNPYVITSETLRSTILFEQSFLALQTDLFFITIYGLTLFVLTIVLMKLVSVRYFHKFKHKAKTLEDSVLHIQDKNVNITNLEELLDFLKTLSEEEYNKYISEHNIFSEFINKVHGRFLARKIRKKELSKVIKILEKKVKKN